MGEILQGWVAGEGIPRDAELIAGSNSGIGALAVSATLAAGAAAIGKLGANSGVDIGDVTVNNTGSNPVIAELEASENLIGLVGSPDIAVTVTPTVDTSAYASGDLLFDSAEIANAVRVVGGTCLLESVTIVDKADQGVAFTLVLANAATDFGAANSAPDPDDTECATVIGWVPVATADYVDLGAAKVACIRNIGLLLKATAAATSLYVAGVNGTGTPTYGAASDLVITFGLLRS